MTPNKPASTGDGVGFADYAVAPSIAARIEWLGRMNDRRLTYLANNDTDGLLQLASEYDERNMAQTAAGIRLAAGKMRR